MSRDPRDYKLDIAGLTPEADNAPASKPQAGARPWLSVHFACCGVYQRIYRAADGTHYSGSCPRCGGKIRFNVAPGGTSTRCFRVE